MKTKQVTSEATAKNLLELLGIPAVDRGTKHIKLHTAAGVTWGDKNSQTMPIDEHILRRPRPGHLDDRWRRRVHIRRRWIADLAYRRGKVCEVIALTQLSDSEQTESSRFTGSVCAAGHGQLAVDPVRVGLDGGPGDVEFRGDGAVRTAFGEQP